MLKALKRWVTKAGVAAKSVAASDFWRNRYASIRASYDAARTSDEYKNIWQHADRYDADSSHSREVRHSLISRSRYEIGNNGYSDGIAQTYATDVVGVGPALRMQTGSEAFNRMVEAEWFRWTKSVKFRRKLWCMAHAKHSDGEGFGVLRRNPRIKHPIALDMVLHEAEQFQTPNGVLGKNQIDGLVVDDFGNPLYYEMIREHPGATNRQHFDIVPERIDAKYVMHWFKMRRPGQHRAVPECASTLNVGAAARRWREATLAAAETAADFTLFIKTALTPEDAATVAPMSTLDINKRMMTALPEGYDPFQMKAEQPTATYAEFSKSLVNEQARPKSMPYNKAACDSSSYNYASGRLDHQTYYAALDVDREDCNDLVLDPAFDVWFDWAVMRFGWLGGIPEAIGPGPRAHVWDWPKHRVADVESEANASKTKLSSGQVFHHQLAAEAGLDFEDELTKAAEAYGVKPDDLRRRLLDVSLPIPQQMVKPADQKPLPGDTPAPVAAGRLNGHSLNGVGHG
jgi:capsid protein|tara:strand:+ start:3580 stop:5124 length:1545 start_codon:yes stop_codon:yes gene_type:complete